MKKVIIVLLVVTTTLYSEELAEYNYTKIHEFSDLYFDIPSAGSLTSWIDDFCFQPNGNIIFADIKNKLIKIYNKEYNFIKSIKVSDKIYGDHNYIKSSDRYITVGLYNPFIYDLENENFEMRVPAGKLDRNNFTIIDRFIVGQTKDQKYFSFEIPETSNKELILRNQADTFMVLSQTEFFEIVDNIVFYNEEMILASSMTFFEYYYENSHDIDPYGRATTPGGFMGYDSENNYYFTNNLYTNIFDSEGTKIIEIKAFIKDPYAGGVKMDKEGNLYYCHLNKENNTVDLYKLDRQW